MFDRVLDGRRKGCFSALPNSPSNIFVLLKKKVDNYIVFKQLSEIGLGKPQQFSSLS